ncbi:ABC transporter substrate-binding protein [Reyranella sp.]|uniref:ABC transporter substrate-binding protein n=1 Tax=Reyranella sp. TaxID=1929291 RepID=UPI003D107930
MKTGLVAAMLCLLLAATSACRAEPPRRVVTVNLCLDQLALRLAAPGQLVGVSYLARDPRTAVLADRARNIPTVRATAESILDLRPDLVVFDSMAHANVKRLVRAAGVSILELPWAASLEEAEVQIARMADVLGRSDQGRDLIVAMRERQRQLVRPGPPTATAAVLQANLRTTGKGSLMDELLGLTGYRNLAADLGISAYGRFSLEAVLAGRPDLVILDEESNADPARATSFVDHPAIGTLARHARILSLPIRYSICAGPENLDALQKLREVHP